MAANEKSIGIWQINTHEETRGWKDVDIITAPLAEGKEMKLKEKRQSQMKRRIEMRGYHGVRV
jgi:hypothetical protein